MKRLWTSPLGVEAPQRVARIMRIARIAPIAPIAFMALMAGLGLAGCASAPAPSQALRIPNAQATSPTSRAVEVPAGMALVFVSGQTPEPIDAQAPAFSIAYWGDTEQQTMTVLRKVQAALQAAGLDMGDVVKMNVYLVGASNTDGRMDTAGFGRAYARFFGSAGQPLRPSRTTVQIAALGLPGMWIEIDVIAAKRPAPGAG